MVNQDNFFKSLLNQFTDVLPSTIHQLQSIYISCNLMLLTLLMLSSCRRQMVAFETFSISVLILDTLRTPWHISLYMHPLTIANLFNFNKPLVSYRMLQLENSYFSMCRQTQQTENRLMNRRV